MGVEEERMSKNSQGFEEKYDLIKTHFLEREYSKSIKEIVKIFNYEDIDEIIIAKLYAMKGMSYYFLNDIDKAIEFYLNAEHIFLNNQDLDIDERRKNKNSLGALYSIQREFKKSLSYLFESVHLGQQSNVANDVAYNNIGLVYAKIDDYETAMQYYSLARDDFFAFKNGTLECGIGIYLNKASALIELDSLSHAELIINKIFNLIKDINDGQVKESFYVIQARLSFKKGDIVKAKNECEYALRFIKNNNGLRKEVNANILMSEILIEMNNFEKAGRFLTRALRLSREVYKSRTIKILKKLVLYHESLKNYKPAQEMLREIIQIEDDERLNFENTEFLKLEKEFEASQKDLLIEKQKVFNLKLREQNKSLEQAIDEQKGIELQIKSLQLQLSPHFIFNTLQSIQGFIFQQDALTTSDYLAKFASLMRSVLNASKRDKISIEEELAILTTYMELEQKRFEDKFLFQIKTEGIATPQETYLPSLLVQPFIENAIIHGLSELDNGLLQIVFRKFGPVLYIHVVDNGIGREASRSKSSEKKKGTSTALKIMQERETYSKESNKFQFTYKIRDQACLGESSGTHVVLRVVDLLQNNNN